MTTLIEIHIQGKEWERAKDNLEFDQNYVKALIFIESEFSIESIDSDTARVWFGRGFLKVQKNDLKRAYEEYLQMDKDIHAFIQKKEDEIRRRQGFRDKMSS